MRDLIERDQYSMSFAEKEAALAPLLAEQARTAFANNVHVRSWFTKRGFAPDSFKRFVDIPPLPTQMFKFFDLGTVGAGQVTRAIRSSGTTGQAASRVPLDKDTSILQTQALNATLKSYLGNKRKVFLVIDHAGMADPTAEMTARAAGVRGLSGFAKKTYFLLKQTPQGLTVDWDALREAQTQHGDDEIFAFGFTFIVWSELIAAMGTKPRDLKLSFPKLRVFHSGGWKKLKDRAVSKSVFNSEVGDFFGSSKSMIHDFYGMAEQGGVVLIDCEHGSKHVPNFATVMIRDPFTLKPTATGTTGLVQVSSALAGSYYGQAVLTEDLGHVVGYDDCPCGRKGERIQIVSRVEKAELRGCGDTFKPGAFFEGVG